STIGKIDEENSREGSGQPKEFGPISASRATMEKRARPARATAAPPSSATDAATCELAATGPQTAQSARRVPGRWRSTRRQKRSGGQGGNAEKRGDEVRASRANRWSRPTGVRGQATVRKAKSVRRHRT